MANTKTSKKGPKPKKTEYYVNSGEFKQEIINYYKTEVCTHKLADMLSKIAHGLSYSSNFINYSYKGDMVGDALVKMYTALKNKKYDVTSDNSPFSYFTTIAFHAFINRIKKEKKHTEAIDNYKEMVYHDEMSNSSDGKVYTRPSNDSDGDGDLDA